MKTTLEERFWMRVDMNGPLLSPYLGKCWVWTGALRGRYTGFCIGGRDVAMAHKWSYELLVGPVPEGLVLDHLCRNRICVNPAHLEAVTNRENLIRGNNFIGKNARKAYCPQGHRYTTENTYVCREGKRSCLACARRRKIERRARGLRD